jgi:hypothetical protein
LGWAWKRKRAARKLGGLRPDSGEDSKILPVARSKSQARKFYDRISRIYDLLSGPFERKPVEKTLELLSA